MTNWNCYGFMFSLIYNIFFLVNNKLRIQNINSNFNKKISVLNHWITRKITQPLLLFSILLYHKYVRLFNIWYRISWFLSQICRCSIDNMSTIQCVNVHVYCNDPSHWLKYLQITCVFFINQSHSPSHV